MRHSVDVHVGQRVRQRRWMVGMTQQQLGDRVGIKFQQIQKYETGANRISASRLWDIAAAMEVPVSFFFEGLEGQAPDTGEARGDVLTDKEALELVRAYYAIPETQRRRLFDLARVLSAAA
jgi:transcriptional regulator with XRE-family HTH domain